METDNKQQQIEKFNYYNGTLEIAKNNKLKHILAFELLRQEKYHNTAYFNNL